MSEQYTDGPNTHRYPDAGFVTDWTVFHLDDPDGRRHTFHVPSRIVDQIVNVEVAASLAVPPDPAPASGDAALAECRAEVERIKAEYDRVLAIADSYDDPALTPPPPAKFPFDQSRPADTSEWYAEAKDNITVTPAEPTLDELTTWLRENESWADTAGSESWRVYDADELDAFLAARWVPARPAPASGDATLREAAISAEWAALRNDLHALAADPRSIDYVTETYTPRIRAAIEAALTPPPPAEPTLDVDFIRAAMHVVLSGNKDAARFVLGDPIPDYIAERIAIEYDSYLAARTAR